MLAGLLALARGPVLSLGVKLRRTLKLHFNRHACYFWKPEVRSQGRHRERQRLSVLCVELSNAEVLQSAIVQNFGGGQDMDARISGRMDHWLSCVHVCRNHACTYARVSDCLSDCLHAYLLACLLACRPAFMHAHPSV